MDADFDEADTDLLTDIVGRLGVADVAEFGLRWQGCEESSPRGKRCEMDLAAKPCATGRVRINSSADSVTKRK